jgi:hypothetical protein
VVVLVVAVAVPAAAAAAAAAALSTRRTLSAIVHSTTNPYFFGIDKHLIEMEAVSIHCLTLFVAEGAWHL